MAKESASKSRGEAEVAGKEGARGSKAEDGEKEEGQNIKLRAQTKLKLRFQLRQRAKSARSRRRLRKREAQRTRALVLQSPSCSGNGPCCYPKRPSGPTLSKQVQAPLPRPRSKRMTRSRLTRQRSRQGPVAAASAKPRNPKQFRPAGKKPWRPEKMPSTALLMHVPSCVNPMPPQNKKERQSCIASAFRVLPHTHAVSP